MARQSSKLAQIVAPLRNNCQKAKKDFLCFVLACRLRKNPQEDCCCECSCRQFQVGFWEDRKSRHYHPRFRRDGVAFRKLQMDVLPSLESLGRSLGARWCSCIVKMEPIDRNMSVCCSIVVAPSTKTHLFRWPTVPIRLQIK